MFLMLLSIAIKHLQQTKRKTIYNKCHAKYLTFIPYNMVFSEHRPAEGTLAALYLCLKVDEHIYRLHILSSHISSIGEISTSAFSCSKGKPCYLYHIASHTPSFYLSTKLRHSIQF